MVIRGDSRDRGGEFQHQMLIGYVSHLFVVIIVLWFEKTLNNELVGIAYMMNIKFRFTDVSCFCLQ